MRRKHQSAFRMFPQQLGTAPPQAKSFWWVRLPPAYPMRINPSEPDIVRSAAFSAAR